MHGYSEIDRYTPFRIRLELIPNPSNQRYLFKVTRNNSTETYTTSKYRDLVDVIKEYNKNNNITKIEYIDTVLLLGESGNETF